MGCPLSKVSSDQYTTFRRSDVDALRRYVNCVELNTRVDPWSSELVNASLYSMATVRPFFRETTFESFCF